jgi:gas vesicle protein
MRFGRYEPSDKTSVGTAVTFLLIGMGAGALVALLLAPQSGKQLRKDLRRKYEGALDTLDDWKDEAKERAEDVLERGAELAEDLRGAAREKVAPLGRALRRE